MRFMKRIILPLIVVLLTGAVWAQSPEKMSFQAVIRNSNNNLVSGRQVGIQISILQGLDTAKVVYSETHTPTTNANGLITIDIGTGSTNDDFSTINWANGPFFIKTETDPEGGTNYTIIGTSQILSVPYALHAKNASYTNSAVYADSAVYAENTSRADRAVHADSSLYSKDALLADSALYAESASLADRASYAENAMHAKTAERIVDTTRHYVGELYGGGIIFYVYDNGTHGLIASLNDLSSGIQWGADGITVANCASAYDGASNTTSIVASLGEGTSFAAGLCDSYTGNGYSDWYLPSVWELNLLYNQAFIISSKLDNDGDSITNGLYFNGQYWSSTQRSSTDAWVQFVGYGYVGANNHEKTHSYYVRAIRKF